MKDAAKRKEAMGSMDKHMTDMHHGMMAVEKHAKDSGNKGMQDSMKQINKDMMMVMKAMGKMKKDPDAAISMMQNGNMKMEKILKKMKSKM